MWTAAAAYDRFMGRWSKRVAALFLDALTVPAAGRCLDVGCGVGSLTAAIVEHCSPRAVVGVDTSAELLRYATKRTPAGTPVCYRMPRTSRITRRRSTPP